MIHWLCAQVIGIVTVMVSCQFVSWNSCYLCLPGLKLSQTPPPLVRYCTGINSPTNGTPFQTFEPVIYLLS